MSSTIEIKDAIYTPPSHTINSITIRLLDYTLGVRARFHVSFREDERVVNNELLVLEGEAFAGWNADDNYVKDWVLNALGLTAKE